MTNEIKIINWIKNEEGIKPLTLLLDPTYNRSNLSIVDRRGDEYQFVLTASDNNYCLVDNRNVAHKISDTINLTELGALEELLVLGYDIKYFGA